MPEKFEPQLEEPKQSLQKEVRSTRGRYQSEEEYLKRKRAYSRELITKAQETAGTPLIDFDAEKEVFTTMDSEEFLKSEYTIEDAALTAREAGNEEGYLQLIKYHEDMMRWMFPS